VTEHPALTALRRLLQQHDPKQFMNGAQQFAWHEARRIVDEADAVERAA